MKARIHGTMLDGCAGRIRAEIVATFPILARPDRPGTKTTAAIRADVVQDGLDAGTAEGAFKRADHRVRGIGRKRRFAVLASWPQFEQGSVLMCALRWLDRWGIVSHFL